MMINLKVNDMYFANSFYWPYETLLFLFRTCWKDEKDCLLRLFITNINRSLIISSKNRKLMFQTALLVKAKLVLIKRSIKTSQIIFNTVPDVKWSIPFVLICILMNQNYIFEIRDSIRDIYIEKYYEIFILC